jgi:hypothetical protein
MFELGLGVILAAWFVAGYFIYRKLFRREDGEPWPIPVINTPTQPQLPENRPPLFLPTAEMSEHHSGENKQ